MNNLLCLIWPTPSCVAASPTSLYVARSERLLSLCVLGAAAVWLSKRIKRAAVRAVLAAANNTIESETSTTVSTLFPSELSDGAVLALPDNEGNYEEILQRLNNMSKFNAKPGKVFGYMYDTADSAYHSFISLAYTSYLSSNGLNPVAFPALRQLENDVVSMALSLLHATKDAAGNMTSGGTESLLLAVLAYRESGRARGISHPNIICCRSLHVAVAKAAHYFDVHINWVDMAPGTYQMDVVATERAIDGSTVAIFSSAPQYPLGIMDDIAALSAIALQHKVGLHVDACMGGFLLPFLPDAGYEVPKWDYQVPGVTSISLDVHKYGYAAKGASVLTFRSDELRRHHFFAFAQWPGGLFVSPSMMGTRAGGAIAAAWAALMAHGRAGYVKRAKELMAVVGQFRAAIASVTELEIIGEPVMSIVAFRARSPQLNIYVVADLLEAAGYGVERQQQPTCLHITITPVHAAHVDAFTTALKLAVTNAHHTQPSGSAAMYGLAAKIPDQTIIEQFLTSFMSKVFSQSKKQ